MKNQPLITFVLVLVTSRQHRTCSKKKFISNFASKDYPTHVDLKIQLIYKNLSFNMPNGWSKKKFWENNISSPLFKNTLEEHVFPIF